MVLSKRERYIGIAAAGVLALLVVDHYLLTPFVQRHEQAQVAGNLATADLAKAEELFAGERKLRPVWTSMLMGGLKSVPSQAESQAQNALLEWARSSGVSVASLKPERSAQENQFQVINFGMTGTGTMASISRMLFSVESSAIPVRLTQLQVTPRREGTDDLSVRLSLSTLCVVNETPKPNSTRSGR